MKEIRSKFSDEEYAGLLETANSLGITVKQLVRDRSLGIVSEDQPLSLAATLSREIAKTREVLNEIIRREITADERLYEDDVIRMEASMYALERIVTAFVCKQMKEAKKHGNTHV